MVTLLNCIPTAKNLFELRKECYDTLKSDVSVIKESTIKTDVMERVENQIDMLLFNWENDYYMAVACLTALRSKAPRTPVSLWLLYRMLCI